MKKNILAAALLFVLLAFPAAWFQLTKGVMLDGHFFVQRNEDLYVHKKDSVAITRTADGADICITLANEQLTAEMKISDQKYSFAYSDGRTIEGYAGKWLDELVDADGAPIWLEDSIVVTVGNEREPSALTREHSLSNTLYHMAEGICEQRGHILLILAAALFYALGVSSCFWPEKVHFLGGRWMYANAELSDAGIMAQQLSGVICALVGAGLLYAPLFW